MVSLASRRAVCRLLGIALLCPAFGVVAEGPVQYRDPDTGLASWAWEDAGVSVRLVQVLPDYIRGAFNARDLPRSISEKMAGYCVFGTIFRNNSDIALSYRVDDWRFVDDGGREHKPRNKDQWVAEWEAMNIDFRWSLLPAEQTFEPGDWAQGFTTVNLPHGATTDLRMTWDHGGRPVAVTFRQLECAPDVLRIEK